MVMAYGGIDVDQHWPDGTKPLPKQEVCMNFIDNMNSEITLLKFISLDPTS